MVLPSLQRADVPELPSVGIADFGLEDFTATFFGGVAFAGCRRHRWHGRCGGCCRRAAAGLHAAGHERLVGGCLLVGVRFRFPACRATRHRIVRRCGLRGGCGGCRRRAACGFGFRQAGGHEGLARRRLLVGVAHALPGGGAGFSYCPGRRFAPHFWQKPARQTRSKLLRKETIAFMERLPLPKARCPRITTFLAWRNRGPADRRAKMTGDSTKLTEQADGPFRQANPAPDRPFRPACSHTLSFQLSVSG